MSDNLWPTEEGVAFDMNGVTIEVSPDTTNPKFLNITTNRRIKWKKEKPFEKRILYDIEPPPLEEIIDDEEEEVALINGYPLNVRPVASKALLADTWAADAT